MHSQNTMNKSLIQTVRLELIKIAGRTIRYKTVFDLQIEFMVPLWRINNSLVSAEKVLN